MCKNFSRVHRKFEDWEDMEGAAMQRESAGRSGCRAPGPVRKASGKEWGGLEEQGKQGVLKLIACKWHNLGQASAFTFTSVRVSVCS